mmetsp:Transcript_98486/g.278497  ORF Transcript_98486/g.278497 Transcript_98486/m.278497 type:complete len:207 (+) Transcript_98486:73-693(+)
MMHQSLGCRGKRHRLTRIRQGLCLRARAPSGSLSRAGPPNSLGYADTMTQPAQKACTSRPPWNRGSKQRRQGRRLSGRCTATKSPQARLGSPPPRATLRPSTWRSRGKRVGCRRQPFSARVVGATGAVQQRRHPQPQARLRISAPQLTVQRSPCQRCRHKSHSRRQPKCSCSHLRCASMCGGSPRPRAFSAHQRRRCRASPARRRF